MEYLALVLVIGSVIGTTLLAFFVTACILVWVRYKE